MVEHKLMKGDTLVVLKLDRLVNSHRLDRHLLVRQND